MAGAVPHTYRYGFSSALESQAGRSAIRLATSGGASDFPYFFQGALEQPRLTAQLLRTLGKVVSSRFHVPAAMLERILAEYDPVVTSGGGWLRFEGFSSCGSTYARVDLGPDAYDGVVVGQGTTNVDFNAEFRAALAQIRDHERVSLAVGEDEVTLLRGADQIVERKVNLPLRWLKGFVEVQAYQARMELYAELGKVEALRFLRSLPRTVMAKTSFWVVPTGAGLRVSQSESPGALRVGGIERLHVLDELAPWADGLRVYADRQAMASEWELRFGPRRFHLTLSPDVWRGFSGEGQVLSALATGADAALLARVRGALKWQAELRVEEFAANWDVTLAAVRQAIAALGSRGLVGYDVKRAAYFHRELPFDLALVDELHPRLRAAQGLVARDGVRVLHHTPELAEAEVAGTEVVHRVRLAESGPRCSCAWYAKHQGHRGPCKHILAVQLVTHPES